MSENQERIILEMTDIDKTFPGVHALENAREKPQML